MRTDSNTVGYKIYVKGSNGYSQCTGPSSESTQYTWKRVDQKFTNNAPIRSISCGYYHTLVLTENDELFGCGSNSDCQLAHPRSSCSTLSEFTLLNKGDAQNAPLQKVECGGYFSLFLSQSGELYGCGQVIIV
jgi:alpha-tubulin suppressor-like RCC1 family protein